MGVIKKQTIQGSIYTYLGVIISFITTGILMPRLFSSGEIGVLNLLFSYSETLGYFGTLGFSSIIIRMFPYFRNKDNANNGLGFLLIVNYIIGVLLVLGIYALLRNWLIDISIQKSGLFVTYIDYLIPLIIFTTLFMLLDPYASALLASVRGTFQKEFLFRILILFFLIFYYLKVINFNTYVLLYVMALSLPGVLMFIYLFKQNDLNFKPQLGFIKGDMAKTMFGVASTGLMAGFINFASRNLDKIMLSSMISIEQVGVYSIAFLFATIILVPSRAIVKISAPVIADEWKTGSIVKIFEIYKKSIVNQTIVATLLLLGIVVNRHSIFAILPDEYKQGQWVLVFIGISGLIEMMGGVSAIIIQTSSKYKVYTIHAFFYFLATIGFTYFFIQLWGITGASIAAAAAKLVFTYVRFQYLYNQYKMQPYDKVMAYLLLISAVILGINYLIPDIKSIIIDILVRSTMVSVIFGISTYYLSLSDEINQTLHNVLVKVKQWRRK